MHRMALGAVLINNALESDLLDCDDGLDVVEMLIHKASCSTFMSIPLTSQWNYNYKFLKLKLMAFSEFRKNTNFSSKKLIK